MAHGRPWCRQAWVGAVLEGPEAAYPDRGLQTTTQGTAATYEQAAARWRMVTVLIIVGAVGFAMMRDRRRASGRR